MDQLNMLRSSMKENGMEAVFVSNPVNRFYLSGFTGTSGYVLITESEKIFITDFRYKDQAAQQCEGFEIKVHNNEQKVNDILNAYNYQTMGYENEFITVYAFEDMIKSLDQTILIPLGKTIENIRQVKTEEEISKMKVAAQIADNAFEYIVKWIKPGKTEREVALELEFFMKQKGASKLSFETIVASGWRSALPHGVATEKVIESGDFVTLDFGCVYDGYCSDMTRTLVMGKATEEQKKIYNIVLEAQLKTQEAVCAGKSCKEIDTIARTIIEEAGYGPQFGHGTGHAIGLELHEYPRLSQQDETILVENHMVTNEPGIYIPEFGGVRIEDLLRVKTDGYESLTKSPKTLIEIM